MRHRRHNGDAHSPLVVGVILLVIGAGLLAANFGFNPPVELLRYWPFVLLVPGLLATCLPSRHMTRSGGVWLLATGIYGLFGLYRPFGLGWGGAWPIFIVAAGFSVIFDEHKRERFNSRELARRSDGSDPNAGADTAAKNH